MTKMASAARNGIRMMEVSMSGSFHREEQHNHHAGHEQERIGLQVAGLEKAQSAANDLRRSMQTTNAQSSHNPLVEPVGQTRERFMSDGNQSGVNLIEVEPVTHHAGNQAKLGRKRIPFRVAI